MLDADRIARDVVLPGTEGLAAIRAEFGDGVLHADGSLDRQALGAVVFADAARRARLNALVHPRIAAQTAHERAALEARGHDLACYEAALLVENGLADAFRPLVVVLAPVDLQRRRIVERDGLSAEEADRRIAAQAPIEAKRQAADHVIDNDADRASLLGAADRTLDDICRALSLPLRPPAADRP